MIYTPDLNNGRNVFVFGSNEAGRHGKGAALAAVKHWGAIYGQGVGLQGNAYAIPTKDAQLHTLPLEDIEVYIWEFRQIARVQRRTFLITAIGCGLAGYTPEQIAPMFDHFPENCLLPPEFLAVLTKPTHP